MPKFGRGEAAGLAFLIGWIGSWALIEKVIGWDWSSLIYFFIGLILYWIVNGNYEEEVDEKEQNQTKTG